MNRGEFLDALRRALYGKIDDNELADHMSYYEDYIAQEMAKGRKEEEIFEELGDPRLLARTILETSGAKTSYKEYTIAEGMGDAEGNEVHMHQYQGWKGTIILILILMVVILVLVAVFRIFIALLPILLIIGAVGWLTKKIWS